MCFAVPVCSEACCTTWHESNATHIVPQPHSLFGVVYTRRRCSPIWMAVARCVARTSSLLFSVGCQLPWVRPREFAEKLFGVGWVVIGTGWREEQASGMELFGRPPHSNGCTCSARSSHSNGCTCSARSSHSKPHDVCSPPLQSRQYHTCNAQVPPPTNDDRTKPALKFNSTATLH